MKADKYLITQVSPNTDINNLTATQVKNLMESYAIHYHEGELESMVSSEGGKCHNPSGCACKEANGYELTDCNYFE